MATVTAPIAEHLGVPVVIGHLFPMMFPTRLWTPPLGSARATWAGGQPRAVADPCGREQSRVLRQPHQRAATLVRARAIRGNALKAFMTAARTVMLVSRHYYGDGAALGAGDVGRVPHWAGPAGQQS